MNAYNDIKNGLMIALAIILALVSVLMWTGCMSAKKAGKKIAVIEAKQPQVLLKYCGSRFPPIVFDSTRIEYVPGVTEYFIDTVTIDCDSVIKAPVLTKVVKAPCPPSTHRTDTVYSTRTVQVESKAKIELLTGERDDCKGALIKAEQGRSTWRWIGIGLLVYCAVRIVLRLWLKINLP